MALFFGEVPFRHGNRISVRKLADCVAKKGVCGENPSAAHFSRCITGQKHKSACKSVFLLKPRFEVAGVALFYVSGTCITPGSRPSEI